MATVLNDSIQINAPRPIDNKYMKFSGGSYVPYVSVAEANSLIPLAYRSIGLTVLIAVGGNKEYWYKTAVADGNLVEKSTTGGGGGTVFIDKFTPGDPGKPADGATTFTYVALIGKSVDNIQIFIDGVLLSNGLSDRRSISAFNSGTGQVTINSPINSPEHVQIFA